ncbi:MAG: response regulator [Anaerolineae bacterium]|nr:response regulator [Anaerolineae bacterium]
MKGTRILIIDDEEEVLEQLGYAMTQAGYQVDLARDGDVGWEHFQQKLHPVVITDLRMPQSRDGLEVLEEIKRLWPATHVIVLTGHGGKADAIQSLRLQAFDYIEKGSSQTLPVLKEAVARACEDAGLSAELPGMPNELALSVSPEELQTLIAELPFSISDEINKLRKVEA